ncbi:MAG: DUF3943 domain-containing protein [Myxococcales bacterium]|nr:DUF3943 domain-containing protein [Myxococcales bacterium]
MTTATTLSFAASLLSFVATSAHAESSDKLTKGLEQRAPRAHHKRMAIELAAVFAVGNRWYWRDNGKPNEVDWQLRGDAALQAKLGGLDAWRFDGNPYDINALGHPGFGMLTHFLARENGYGLGEAFAISTLASGTWEVFLELREYGSLNDMAVTSTAGLPLGETAYQMIHHASETHLELRGGMGLENGDAFGIVGVRGELDRIPSQGRGTFRGGRHVSFAAELPTDELGVRSYEGGAKSTVAGYYRNTDDSRLVAGVSAEFDYRKDEERTSRDWDLWTAVAFGPSIDYQVRHPSGLTLALGADLYVDFGMLKAQAFEAWRAEHPDERMRNVMEGREHPYYFGLGASMDPRVNIAYGGYFAGARLSGTRFGSLDSADRDQEMLSNKLHFTDRDANAELAAGYSHDSWSLMLDGRLHRRDGRVGTVEDAASRHTAMLTFAVRR